ncbi:ran GTPase-activating protein 1 [Trichomonascus vanleenenianus]|uniref:GTPase-activating protein RNA1 n=1 Tax=Trichomonascus vanleenenianus TaxID=2268995 RepID=UPI003ECA48E0
MATTFSLNGKGLKLDTAEDIKPHLEELVKSADSVTEINLAGNTYGVEASKELARVARTLKNLETADLSDIFTGRLREEIPTSLDAILTAFLDCKKLHTLDLSDNAFGIATIDPLESFLAKHAPLRHLILANNGFGPQAGSRIGKALEELAQIKKEKETHSLETIVCGRNRLENGSMAAWAKMLAAHGTVKELRLYQNGIRQEGIEHLLLKGLSKSPVLEKLDLQDNTFTMKGAKALVEVLPTWTQLKELVVSDCLLTAEGGYALSQALVDIKPLESLEVLKLQYNEIETDGLEKLKHAIEKNIPNLKVLELNGNRFPEDHEHVDAITQIFVERGFGELDELDDMEEETDVESEEEAEEEEEVKHAQEEEEENVAPENSAEVDELADEISRKL